MSVTRSAPTARSQGSRRSAFARNVRWLAATLLVLSIVAGAGCELVVGESLPSFSCIPRTDYETCPTGQICDPARRQCVVPCDVQPCGPRMQCSLQTRSCVSVDTSSSNDATADDAMEEALQTDATNWADADGSSAPGDSGRQDGTVGSGDSGGMTEDGDSASDGPACGTGMCKCAGPGDCASGICAAELTIGTGLYRMAGSVSFCTKPCCSSADCDRWTVCYATSNGGNYCVLPSLLGRSSVLGDGFGGRSCLNNTECRSGLCAGGTCADTCCSTNRTPIECAGAGVTCAFSAFPGMADFDRAFVANCGFGGGAKTGSNCATADDCQTGVCDGHVMPTCRNLCRNTADCNGGLACVYTDPNLPRGVVASPNPVVAACSPSAGNKAEGAFCMTNTECQSAFCDPVSRQCTDVCFDDSDCTVANWRCRPEQLTVGAGAASVLCCGL